MTRHILCGVVAAVMLAAVALPAPAKDKAPQVYPTAILPFQERGDEVKDYGGKVTQLLFANMAANPDLFLVDR